MINIISQVIREKRITQAELARLVGVKREYINRIVHQKITPTIPLGMRIAGALGVSVEDLFILEE
jgi:DNA-binding XRE family transcriptional regulator